MTTIQEKVWALGRERIVTYDDAARVQLVAGPSTPLIYKPVGICPYIAGWDTSETLSSSAVSALAALRAYGFGCRYVPLYGQSSYAGIQPSEWSSLLTAGFGIMLVQFARTGTFSQATWRADGQAAAEAALKLGVAAGASSMTLWMDCAIFSSVNDAINGCNAWYGGAVAAGFSGAQTGVYFEPGVPLTSQQRYADIAFSHYWITAAADPNRFPAKRGGQIYQLWPGDRTVTPGVVVDNDAAQEDYLGSYPIAAFAA